MNFLSSTLLLIGSGFLLLAALGIVRMPDLYIRMSSASKAVTLGVGCLALGLAMHMNDSGVTTRAVLLMLLFLMKAPVAAHMLGRAAYTSGVPLWETSIDEMKGPGRDLREEVHAPSSALRAPSPPLREGEGSAGSHPRES